MMNDSILKIIRIINYILLGVAILILGFDPTSFIIGRIFLFTLLCMTGLGTVVIYSLRKVGENKYVYKETYALASIVSYMLIAYCFSVSSVKLNIGIGDNGVNYTETIVSPMANEVALQKTEYSNNFEHRKRIRDKNWDYFNEITKTAFRDKTFGIIYLCIPLLIILNIAFMGYLHPYFIDEKLYFQSTE